jgi:MerR family transcriptional regulator, repressor of the yfmOP operon
VSATQPKPLRIGEVAELLGTTARTIRYYEEIGLLPGADRAQGKHRAYTESDVERLREIIRLRDLLGLPLEELSALLEAEAARAAIRREIQLTEDPAEIQRLREEALGHINTQLELVRRRRRELEQLEGELQAKRRLVQRSLAEMEE